MLAQRCMASVAAVVSLGTHLCCAGGGEAGGARALCCSGQRLGVSPWKPRGGFPAPPWRDCARLSLRLCCARTRLGRRGRGSGTWQDSGLWRMPHWVRGGRVPINSCFITFYFSPIVISFYTQRV